jgi:hypothetical protein
MSKNAAYIVSAVLFVLLLILFVCEIKAPEAGYAFIEGIIH